MRKAKNIFIQVVDCIETPRVWELGTWPNSLAFAGNFRTDFSRMGFSMK